MNRPLPPITESADALKAQMKQETHKLKRQRLHMLYLLTSEQVPTCQDAVDVLGVHS